MSAAEIIEQIKRLPPEEKRAVKDFVNGPLAGGSSEESNKTSFKAAADEVFTKYDNLLRKLAQ
jgi:hypothetical protein